MSIENDGDQIALVCDECGDTIRTYHRGEFDEMIHHAKLKGWKIDNRRGVYFHACGECCDELAAFGIVE